MPEPGMQAELGKDIKSQPSLLKVEDGAMERQWRTLLTKDALSASMSSTMRCG
jgi:hypothetical protein